MPDAPAWADTDASRGHTVEDYLRAVDTLTAPIAECGALTTDAPTLAAYVSKALGVSRVSAGAMLQRLERLGLVEFWIGQLTHGRWWRRANAAHALGLARIARATPTLLTHLPDPHPEVRAALIDALGRIADISALPALIDLLADPERSQRERIIGALHGFRSDATAPLVAWGRREPAERALVADALGLLGGDLALPALMDWCGDADARVREAALRTVGTIGINDDVYYVLLRALGDESVRVRAMAARALGRSGRTDAAPYLAARMGDEWDVAAQAARALRDLRAAGRPHLEAAAVGSGAGANLAHQMLWEAGQRA